MEFHDSAFSRLTEMSPDLCKNVKNVNVTFSGYVYKYNPLPEKNTIILCLLQSSSLFKLFIVQQNSTCFPNRNISTVYNQISSMPTTRKQKKARKSRALEMLSDIENLDIKLGGRHSESEKSVDSNLARRPESTNSNLFENNKKTSCLNSRRAGYSDNTGLGQNSTSANSSAEIKRLSSALSSRTSSDAMMNSVSVQIQRAISDAINSQVLPQIQNALRAGSGQTTQKGWNLPAERPEYISKESCNE